MVRWGGSLDDWLVTWWVQNAWTHVQLPLRCLPPAPRAWRWGPYGWRSLRNPSVISHHLHQRGTTEGQRRRDAQETRGGNATCPWADASKHGEGGSVTCSGNKVGVPQKPHRQEGRCNCVTQNQTREFNNSSSNQAKGVLNSLEEWKIVLPHMSLVFLVFKSINWSISAN